MRRKCGKAARGKKAHLVGSIFKRKTLVVSVQFCNFFPFRRRSLISGCGRVWLHDPVAEVPKCCEQHRASLGRRSPPAGPTPAPLQTEGRRPVAKVVPSRTHKSRPVCLFVFFPALVALFYFFSHFICLRRSKVSKLYFKLRFSDLQVISRSDLQPPPPLECVCPSCHEVHTRRQSEAWHSSHSRSGRGWRGGSVCL